MLDMNNSQIMSPYPPLPLKVGVMSPSSYGSAAHGAAVDCSRYEPQQPEKFGRRRLITAYDG